VALAAERRSAGNAAAVKGWAHDLGAFLELLLVLSNVGTAVVLYPIARRQNEYLAIGDVGTGLLRLRTGRAL
jgi:hypothetical protein